MEWTNEGDAKNVYLVVTVAPESVLPEDANRYELRIDVNPPFSCRGFRDVGGDRDSAQVITPNQDGTGMVGDGAMCEGADVDLYRIDLDPGQTADVRLNNSPRFPLDLRILDAASIIDYGEAAGRLQARRGGERIGSVCAVLHLRGLERVGYRGAA